jgi:hypothetical protein
MQPAQYTGHKVRRYVCSVAMLPDSMYEFHDHALDAWPFPCDSGYGDASGMPIRWPDR